jgi:signal transduction histidine kinase
VEHFHRSFMTAFAVSGLYRAEVRVRDKVGEVRWLRCEGVPRQDDVGRFLGYTNCALDITQVRRAADELERHVQERTAELSFTLAQLRAETLERELTEEALRQAHKMEAVGQLTAGLAHDFNNFLTVITGSLELLERDIGGGRLAEVPGDIAAAKGAAASAVMLTRRLLAFSRNQTLEPKPINPDMLVADMKNFIRQTIGPRIVLRVIDALGLWPALVDANQLENALLNLCINARDAMPEGGTLTIETKNVSLKQSDAAEQDMAAGEYIALAVSDTGTGMSPAVIAQAFNPFFTTKPIGQGTGLGLSMTYGFAKQSGGQVRIQSQERAGSTVTLYLPRHRGEPNPLVLAKP